MLSTFLLNAVSVFAGILIYDAIKATLSTFSFRVQRKPRNTSPSDVHDEPELSIYELERLQREKNFDQRIAQMKEELANSTADKHADKRTSGTTAEVLHPDVHNLPHNSINPYQSLIPDVEVSE